MKLTPDRIKHRTEQTMDSFHIKHRKEQAKYFEKHNTLNRISGVHFFTSAKLIHLTLTSIPLNTA